MIFKQLFHSESCTYTYLIGDTKSKEAVFIDPVNSDVDEYLALLKRLGLKLVYSFETHVHADHVSGSGLLRQATRAETCIGLHCGAELADNQLQGGEVFRLGENAKIQVLATPGHTLGSMSFLWNDRVFTGDALFIGGCGRTDFQNGDPGELYDSVTQKLFTLPGETLVYPAHDYKGDFVSCIHQEKSKNPRLAGKTRDEFIDIMNNLNLPVPKLIDKAVPANLYCGLDEEEASQMASDSEFIKNNNDLQRVVNQIDTLSAKTLIEGGGIVIDVRENNEYALGHIENSINIPRGDILLGVEDALNIKDKSAQILLYCASGRRSILAGLMMEEMGYSNIVSLQGGYIEWKRSGH